MKHIIQLILSVCVLVMPGITFAQQAELVKNIGDESVPNTFSTFSSYPQYITEMNGTLYFAAGDGSNGYELWKSEGTTAGTVLIKDIFIGPNSSQLRDLTRVGDVLYFTATDGVQGMELWKSDGTAAGTVMVKDIYPGPNSGYPEYLTNYNGMLYFIANDGVTNNELWKSDGTAEGTVLVKDLNPGGAYGNPQYLTNVNGTLYLAASNGLSGQELWKSDGTAAGTVLVKDIVAGSWGSYPRYLTNVNGTLYFTAEDGVKGNELWKSDGTAAGTVLVKDVMGGSGGSYPQFLTNVNGLLYFSADDGTNGQELWKSNGTAAGTVLVKDIYPGTSWDPYDFSSRPNTGQPRFLCNVNGMLYFVAYDGVNGFELWKSDGSAAGTVLVKDIYPGSTNGEINSSMPQYLVNVNGVLYFSADDGVNGFELWKSDGTAAGTVLAVDVLKTQSSSPRHLVNANGVLYFNAYDKEYGTELWKSDGTAAGTVLVKDIFPAKSPNGSPAGSNPQYMTEVAGTLYFTASDGVSGNELWKSDGTAAGTVLVKDIVAGSGSSSPEYLTNVNGTLYFTANDGVAGYELWKSDGTVAGTVLVKDILAGGGGSRPEYLTNVNGTLYFSAISGTIGNELWKSDGTAAGTVLVKDILSGSNNSSYPRYMTNVNGTLYFSAYNGVNGDELWKSDGTAAGTVLVKDIFAGVGGSSPQNLTNVNGTLFFLANDGVTGQELWKSDGTAAGTVLAKDLRAGAGSAKPQYLVQANGILYFAADDVTLGRELFTYNPGTGVAKVVADVYIGSGSSSPSYLAVVENTIFFTAGVKETGNELWKFTIKPNAAPKLATIGNKSVNEGSALSFTAPGSDEDTEQTLSYSLINGPAGASIDANTGVFSWTPTEAQGPASYTFKVKVTDNGTPSLSSEETITVTVKEVNKAPVLAVVGNATTTCGNSISFTAVATDPDLPANTLTYSLQGTVPAGASVNASTGAFSWTPAANQLGSHQFTLRASDNGSPVLYHERTFTLTLEDRQAPVVQTKNITVQLDATGVATITAAQLNNGSTDNCSIVQLSLSKTSFTCANIGNNSVILTAADAAGNTATATATVTVKHDTKPVASGSWESSIVFNRTATFAVNNVAVATAYSWEVPAGFEIVSGHNTASVIIKAISGTASGEIVVRAVTACGEGTALRATITAVKAAPVVTFNDLAKTFSLTAFNLSASSSSTGEISYQLMQEMTSDYPGDVTLSGAGNGTVTVVKSGKVRLSASVAADENYTAGTAEMVLTIAKATATLTISDLEQEYNEEPRPVTITTNPSGLSVEVSYNGSVAVPSAAGEYEVRAVIMDDNYTGEAMATLVIKTLTAVSDPEVAKHLKLYPNPTAGTATLELALGVEMQIRVTDLTGRMVKQAVAMHSYELNLESWPAGVYLVHVQPKGKGAVTIKLMKQ